MKITKYLRFLLIALAAVMAFSLFACTEPEEEESSSVEEPSESDSTPVGGPEDSEDSSEETSTPETDCQHVEEVLEAVAATCEETGLTAGKKCSVCGEILEAQTEVPALGHAWGDGVVTTEPDCDTAGVKTYTCGNDATHTKTEEIAALGHKVATYTTYVANPDGDEALIAGECSVCHEMGTKPASFFLTVEIIYGNVNNDTVVVFPTKDGEILMAPGKLTFAPGHPNYPADGFAPIALDCPVYDGAFNGMIGLSGWVGYLGADIADGAQFKVVDAEGNVLVEWTNLTQLTPNASDEGVNTFLAGAFTDMTAVGYRYANIIDLKPYWGILNGKTVTVELAFTTTKGVDGDVYIPYASLEVVVPACEHVAGEPDIADNCNVKCTKCGAVLEAAKHVFTEVAAVEATCDTAGNVAHNHCATCGKNYDAEGAEIADVVIPALGHNQVDKTFTAPTTAEDGWYAHKYCETCGTAWSTEGEKLDAVPTIAKIVPDSEIYFGVAELGQLKPSGGGKTYKDTVISADRTFVRYERDGTVSVDGSIMLLEGNTVVTGRYFIMKYRTDHMVSGEFWANTTQNGHSGLVNGELKPGVANKMLAFKTDSEWHLIVMDLSKEMPKYVQANEEGKYVIQWSRLDCMNNEASEGYFDIAYIVFCDDLADAAFALQEGDADLCTHIAKTDPTYTNEGTNHSTPCALCGKSIFENHSINGVPTWNAETQKYAGTCKCGAIIESNMLYVSEPSLVGVNCVTAVAHEEEGGFVRYTVAKSGDIYLHVYAGGNAISGQYAVVKYRLSNGGKNAKSHNSFSGTVSSPTPMAASANDGNSGSPGTLYGDGEWYYLIICCNSKNFTANEDGTYSAKFLRIGLSEIATDGSAYIDVAEVAWADNLYAAENYAYTNNPNPVYIAHLDKANCSFNGEDLFSENSMRGYTDAIVFDLEGKTVNDPATGLVMGGWVCTPGGAVSYSIRVTSVDGEAVADPALVKWTDGANRGDIYSNVGKGYGYSDNSAKGAGMPKSSIDLSAYAGHKISFEIVGLTNYGAEISVVQVNNLTIATVDAAQ